MARDWEEVPIAGELFENLPETMLSKSLGAMENVFVTEGKTHSRFPGLKHWGGLTAPGQIGTPVDLKDVVGSIPIQSLTPPSVDSIAAFSGAAYGLVYAPEFQRVIAVNNSTDDDDIPGVIISNTGRAWTTIPDRSMDVGTWADVDYSPSQRQLIAVQSNNSGPPETAMRSIDGGLNWLYDVDLPRGSSWVLRVEDWGLWLAGKNGTPDNVYRSATGLSGTWLATDVESLSAGSQNDACYSPSLGRAIVVCSSNNSILWSDDGAAWNAAVTPPPTSGVWRSCAWCEDLGIFVISGSTAGAADIATSPDGKVWTNRVSPDSSWSGNGATFSPRLGLIVITGEAFTANAGHVVTSSNGIDYALQGSVLGGGVLEYLRDAIWIPERRLFVSGGKDLDGDLIMIYSETGLAGSWVRATPPGVLA